MTPNEYQKLALRTEKTPTFIEGDVSVSRVLHGAIGMATEVGELQDAVKKHLIYGKSLDDINVIEECGDVLWYIALVLDAAECSMERCMESNIAKLKVRYHEKFTEEQALVRDLDSERAALEGDK